MKKIELIDLVRSNKSVEPFQHHPEIISRYIALGYNDIFYAKFLRYINLGAYIKRSIQSVTRDEDLNMFHCPIPSSIISTMVYPDGITRITEKKGAGKVNFVPISNQAWPIFMNLEVSKAEDTIYYTAMDGRIEFHKYQSQIKQVAVYYLPSFESLDDEYDIPLPSGKAMELVTMISQFITGKAEAKESNDNAKTI